MKRVAVVLLLAAVLVTALSSAAAAQSVNVDVKFSGTSLTLGAKTGADNSTYSTVSLAGCYESTTDVGEPGIPDKTLWILLPPGSNIDTVVATPVNQQVYPTANPVYPKQPPSLLSINYPYPSPLGTDYPAPPWVGPDPVTYASVSPYPGNRITWHSNFDHIGDYICAEVTVYPLDYTGGSQQLTLYTDIAVTVNYHSGGNNPLPVVRRSALASAEMRSYIAALVQNPELLSTYIDPTADAQTVDFAIIAPNPVVSSTTPAWQVLADWRTRCGVVTKVVDAGWIANNFSGVDLAERIRKFIQYAYGNWGTIYFLLGGDTDSIPARKANYDDYSGTWGPTDLYYSGLDGDWNADGNAQFGEGDDNCDDTPDVFVGRAPVHNQSEVYNFVTKVMNYENPPATGAEPGYPASALLMGAGIDGTPGNFWGQDIKNSIASTYLPAGWYRYKLYDPLDSGDELLSRDSAVANLSMGYHLVNHADHCNPYAMGTGSPVQ